MLFGRLLGAPGGSFSGTPNVEKHTFPQKCENVKKLGISLYPCVLTQKQHLGTSGGPKKETKHLQNVLRKESD